MRLISTSLLSQNVSPMRPGNTPPITLGSLAPSTVCDMEELFDSYLYT